MWRYFFNRQRCPPHRVCRPAKPDNPLPLRRPFRRLQEAQNPLQVSVAAVAAAMGGASRLLSSLLLTSSPLRLRPSAAASALFISTPTAASRRQLLLSSPSPLRTLCTSAAAASPLPYSSSSASQPHAPFPEYSRLVDRLAAAGYAARVRSASDELAVASGVGLSAEAESAVSSCLAFARDRPDLLR